MGKSITEGSGDGTDVPLRNYTIQLPDANGGNVLCSGTLQQPGNPAVALSVGNVAIPAAPGAGQIFYILQADYTVGTVTMKQSTLAYPIPDANNLQIYQETLGTADTDPALAATVGEPDSW